MKNSAFKHFVDDYLYDNLIKLAPQGEAETGFGVDQLVVCNGK